MSYSISAIFLNYSWRCTEKQPPECIGSLTSLIIIFVESKNKPHVKPPVSELAPKAVVFSESPAASTEKYGGRIAQPEADLSSSSTSEPPSSAILHQVVG